MKYFNIKRYKFSTVTKKLENLLADVLDYLKFINYRKFFNSVYYIKRNFFRYFDSFKKIGKYTRINKINIIDKIKKIKVKSNQFLFIHFPAFLIFFGFLYLIIPSFYNYEKSDIKKIICSDANIKCTIDGKVNYSFWPTPRIKIKDLKVNLLSENEKNFLKSDIVLLKLSIKNLLAKDKHKIKKVVFVNFENNINLYNLKKYNTFYKKNISIIPTTFKNGKILLNDRKNYVATIGEANINTKSLKNGSETQLKGKFLNNNIVINMENVVEDNKPITKIEFKVKNFNFLTKIIFSKPDKIIKDGKFLIRYSKNKISGIFDYENDEIIIVKSNLRNLFVDGKLMGKILFTPFFDFDLDLNLNSINFTKLYTYFLSLSEESQKKLFKINNKINGKLNFSSEKVYSKYNLVKSFESRIKFYNGNLNIEQFIFNLGKLGAADILGAINNDPKTSNFKFESNIFVDNEKKFLSKFGIYNSKNLSPNLFIQGNFDFENIRASFYEISDSEKFKIEDINYIETEFNEQMLENEFADLFNFQKFKIFLKSVREDKN